MYEVNKPTEREQSEFNSAISYLGRLNLEHYILAEAKFQNNTSLWYSSLMVLFTELSTEMEPEEIEGHLKTIKELKARINRQQVVAARTGRNNIPQDLYWDLMSFELELRKVMRESGLQHHVKEATGQAWMR